MDEEVTLKENAAEADEASVNEEPQLAPFKIDVESNDFSPKEEQSFDFTLSETDALVMGNALALSLKEAWMFSPEQTINDDVQASFGVLQVLKQFNARLPLELRQGCISQEYLRKPFGDVYVDALYRIDTRLKGKVIALAQFTPSPDHIVFRLFDPVKYPNAMSIYDCLGDEVGLDEVNSIEEVSGLTEEEKEGFSTAISHAWVNFY